MRDASERERSEFGLVIFDGDDTLWETQILYDKAKLRFASQLEDLAPKEDILALLEDIDIQQVATVGYSPLRFPSSLVKTYETLSYRRGWEPSPVVARELRALGDLVFEQAPALYSDTVEVLSHLRRSYCLVLVTKGDLAVQKRRVTQTGVASLFDRVYIVEDKDKETYARVVQGFREAPDRTWVVGNSIRSDINPGLQLGLHCILLERSTWHYEKVDLDAEEVAVARSLSEAAAIITGRSPVATQEGQW